MAVSATGTGRSIQQVSAEEADRILPDPSPSKRRPQSYPIIQEEELTLEALAVRVQHLEQEIGDVPRHAKREQGSGIWGMIHELNESVKGLGERMTQFIAAAEERDRLAVKTAAETAAKRAASMAPISKVGWTAATVVITILTTTLIAAIGAYLSNLHYRPQGTAEPERGPQHAYQIADDLPLCSCGPREGLAQRANLPAQSSDLDDAPGQQ